MNRRTLTMNWDGLGEDDEEVHFFDPADRSSSATPSDLCSSGSDEDGDFEDSRMSFASAISSSSFKSSKSSSMGSYDMWISEPGDIQERRKRLLQGMGLSSTKDMLRLASRKLAGAVSRKYNDSHDSGSSSAVVKVESSTGSKPALEVVKLNSSPEKESRTNEPSSSSPPSQLPPIVLVRSRSDSDIEAFSDRQVVDWTDAREMVTAACFTPDGQVESIGSHQGICRFYNVDDCRLEHTLDIQMKTKAQSKKLPGFQTQLQEKKITGFQFAPWNPSEVLITSTDSRIRIYNGPDLIQKYRGFRNTSSQISASFSPDGKHVISASEDSQIYIWKVEEFKNPNGGKKRSNLTVLAHEHFQCKDVTAAIAWPGSTKNEAPVVEIHSKQHSKRFTAPTPNSPTFWDSGAGASSRRHLPPLPKKNIGLERIDSIGDDYFAPSGRLDPGIGVSNSFRSSSASISYHDSPSISGSSPSQYSRSPSRSVFDNGGANGGQIVQATAWGMVIVTASLEGEIRVYQNFGLPKKVSRQANLFGD